jgi:hypothetical protein
MSEAAGNIIRLDLGSRTAKTASPPPMTYEDQLEAWAEAADIDKDTARKLIADGEEPTVRYFNGARPS